MVPQQAWSEDRVDGLQVFRCTCAALGFVIMNSLVQYDFAWYADGKRFELSDAAAVAPGRPAQEQLRVGRKLVAQLGGQHVLGGALPFDLQEPGALWVGRPEPVEVTDAVPGSGRGLVLDEQHEAAEDARFLTVVGAALEAIARGDFSKVVPARSSVAVADTEIDVRAVVDRLSRDAAAVAFACRVGNSYLVGASPEILIRRTGGKVVSTPLAGSRSRKTLTRDGARRVLLASRKDLHEHDLVVREIQEALRESTQLEPIVSGPEVVGTERMWHLGSKIGVDAADAVADSLSLVEAVHPTAAVCGAPRAAAREFLSGVESRSLYSGAVGWQDASGDGEWRITLRCGLIAARRVELHAGAGIVAGSEPLDELAETKAKMQTLWDAL